VKTSQLYKTIEKIISFMKVGSPATLPKIKCRNSRINLVKVWMQHTCCFNHFYYFQELETSPPCLPVLFAIATASGGAGEVSSAAQYSTASSEPCQVSAAQAWPSVEIS